MALAKPRRFPHCVWCLDGTGGLRAKVCELDVALGAQHHVLQLEVTVPARPLLRLSSDVTVEQRCYGRAAMLRLSSDVTVEQRCYG